MGRVLHERYDGQLPERWCVLHGKTVAQTQTITLVSNTVSISANVDSVVRSKQFSVTITGKPNMVYHLWVKGTSTMDGHYDNQPPMIGLNQAGITMDPATTANLVSGSYVPYDPSIPSDVANASNVNGNYTWQNGAGKNVFNDVSFGYLATGATYPTNTGNGNYVYANVKMSTSGTRTVGFTTTNWTRAHHTPSVLSRISVVRPVTRATKLP